MWRSKIKNIISKKQIDRLASLSGRTEALWKLALRRLQIAETEARRDIDYYGKASPVEVSETRPVSREQIEAALNDPDGAYQRLRRVMDAWNALWFWPLTERATGGVRPPSLDEWFGGLEGILGFTIPDGKNGKYGHVAGQTSILSGASWGDLDGIESTELSLSRAVSIESVLSNHPWLTVCERIASEQGYFHWDLDFASIFGRGGFDLQVGNPPWVRPRSDDAALLAEADPWWQLVEKPTQAAVNSKRAETLSREGMTEFFIENAVTNPVVAEYLGAVATYPVLSGLQPDLYRTFMVRTWASASDRGVVALIHPESHFTEKKAAALRTETYRHLRRHWQFINELSLFEIHHLVTYGVHVYGASRESPSFRMAASLYHPDTVVRSEDHKGMGEVPGLKDADGKWDTRPHAERIIHVDEAVLAIWADILDEPGTPPIQARMVYPVNRASSRVLEKLSKAPRVREVGLRHSSGWHETADRKKGYFEVGSAVPTSWSDVILQGPHFTVANPFAKQPNPTMKNNLDWTEIDLEAIPADFIPRTSYQPSGKSSYATDYGRVRRPNGEDVLFLDAPRLCWRRMAASTGKRTLHLAVLPPGPAHVDGVHAAALTHESSSDVFLIAGTLSSIVVDFFVKTSGVSDLRQPVFDSLPLPLNAALALKQEISAGAFSLIAVTETLRSIAAAGTEFEVRRPLLVAAERRRAETKLDALAALAFGLSADELCTIYRTQFPVLRGYERADLYDANGRKIPGEISKLYRRFGDSLTPSERTWTHPQSDVEYVFELPFRSFDREDDMRKAYAHFEQMLAEKQTEEPAQ